MTFQTNLLRNIRVVGAPGYLHIDPEDLSDLNESLESSFRALRQAIIGMDRMRVSITKDVSLSTSETAVAHSLSRTPTWFDVMLHGDARWYRSKPSDDRYVYLKASGAVTADVLVWG